MQILTTYAIFANRAASIAQVSKNVSHVTVLKLPTLTVFVFAISRVCILKGIWGAQEPAS
jgi:hypothetical protein